MVMVKSSPCILKIVILQSAQHTVACDNIFQPIANYSRQAHTNDTLMTHYCVSEKLFSGFCTTKLVLFKSHSFSKVTIKFKRKFGGSASIGDTDYNF